MKESLTWGVSNEAGQRQAGDGRTPTLIMRRCRSKVVVAVRSIIEVCWCVLVVESGRGVQEDKLR